MLSLPYQPLEQIRYSLPAADIHVVILGNDMVGIIHPCKIYGAMTVGRPVLFIGPRPSHASEVIDDYKTGWHVDLGDADATVETLRRVSSLPPAKLAEMGQRAQSAIREEFSKTRLCATFCDSVEGVVQQTLHPHGTNEIRRQSVETVTAVVNDTA
jgi:glycosyltransferase involved in cell wall biosynthesis